MDIVVEPGTQHRNRLALRPFRGLRYNVDEITDLGAVTSPPYDVMDRAMIDELLRQHPRNIVRLVLPRLVADPVRTDSPYAQAAKLLSRWIDSRVLLTDAEPALYVYEYGAPDYRVCGLVGALELTEPTERIVLPHEDVIPDIVADRLAMMTAAQANLEPILLVYDGAGATHDIVEAVRASSPLLDVGACDGTVHRLWSITDPIQLRKITKLLEPHQALIADGHHRYATYLELRRRARQGGASSGPWDRGLALLIDQSRYPLQLGAIHRSVSEVSLDSLRVPAGFHISEPDSIGDRAQGAPTKAREVVATDGFANRTITLPGRTQEVVTDAELVHDQLLRTWRVDEHRVGYHHTVEQALRAARQDGGVAILLHPPSLHQVVAVARTGRMLPRKSTSFGPKPRTGLVMRRFAAER
ncbi:MAG: DUF1015 family protein [Nocardioidaceae bacterium]